MLSQRRRALVESARSRARAAKVTAFTPAASLKRGAKAVSNSRRLVRRGRPCSELDEEFRDLLQHTGLSAAQVLGSEVVGNEVAAVRLGACRVCVHASVFMDGFMQCECYTCNRWRPPRVVRANDLRELTRHAQYRCPRNDPAFGPVDDNLTARQSLFEPALKLAPTG